MMETDELPDPDPHDALAVYAEPGPTGASSSTSSSARDTLCPVLSDLRDVLAVGS